MLNKIKEFFIKAFSLRRAKGNIGIHSGLSKEICTHGEQFPTQAESEDPDFFGIHFEGLGNVWSAMFTPERININDVLSWIINVGKVRNNSHAFYEEDMLVALFEAPESGNIRRAVLVVNTEGGKGTQLYSSYPVLQGLSNELVITNFYTWSNGVEGVVAAQLGEMAHLLLFLHHSIFAILQSLLLGRNSQYL